MKEVDAHLQRFHAEEDRLNQVKFNLEESEDVLKNEARNTALECQHLKQRQNIRLEYLKKHEPDVYKAMEWLEKNRTMFQSRIYNPMLLEVRMYSTRMSIRYFLCSSVDFKMFFICS